MKCQTISEGWSDRKMLSENVLDVIREIVGGISQEL